MARTLQQLKQYIESMIEEQGPHAPVTAWIYTKDDFIHLNIETEVTEDMIDYVLGELEYYVSVYDNINNLMEDEVKIYSNKLMPAE